MKVRPLGNLSAFVADGSLADKLASSPDFTADVDTLVGQIDENEAAMVFAGSNYQVAALDLKMIELGMVHSGIPVPRQLAALVEMFSIDMPMLTYEEIVIMNPASDLRTFTRDEFGATEAIFYSTHRTIEDKLAVLCADLRAGINSLNNGTDPDDVALMIGEHVGFLSEILASMKMLGEMQKGHFGQFRKYLGTHPTRNLKGPSGAFSAGFPTLEILLRGEEMPEEYMKYLDTNGLYLPRVGRAQLYASLKLAKSGQSLAALSRSVGRPSALEEQIQTIGTFFNNFRKSHYRAVGRQLPDAVNDRIAGTAGEEKPGEFLRKRIETTKFMPGVTK